MTPADELLDHIAVSLGIQGHFAASAAPAGRPGTMFDAALRASLDALSVGGTIIPAAKWLPDPPHSVQAAAAIPPAAAVGACDVLMRQACVNAQVRSAIEKAKRRRS